MHAPIGDTETSEQEEHVNSADLGNNLNKLVAEEKRQSVDLRGADCQAARAADGTRCWKAAPACLPGRNSQSLLL